ncbi:MAG: LuxR C-terminal-related transcriptional regulator [Anaerolineae bacterium]|nr:LuxR C-terminal-related transcriptional regulator [Anaerolineae bacterium]
MPAEQGQPLSERELEITALVAEGLTNREIAQRIFLSPNTVKVHLRNIFTKTSVSSRTELSMLAVQEGWVEITNPDDAVSKALQHGIDNTESSEIAAPPILPNWPWQRWVIVGVGWIVILTVMLLPVFSSRGATTTGPGQIFGPAQDTLSLITSDMEGRWIEMAPIPVSRAGMGIASHLGKAYIIGGVNSEGVIQRLDIFDIARNQWSSGEPLPEALGNISAVEIKGEIYVPGGCDANLNPGLNVYTYSTQTDNWATVSPLPNALCAYATTSYQDKIFLFGGWDGDSYANAGYVYDPDLDLWSHISPPTVVRGFGGAASLGDRIFYIGGFDGRRELDTCEVYYPEDDTWEFCPSMLQPRGGIGVTATTGRLYVLGGGWDSFLGFNEQFSPESGQWTVLDTPVVGEWRNVGAFVWEQSLYVMGGWSGLDFMNRTYVVEVMPWRVFMPGTFRTP